LPGAEAGEHPAAIAPSVLVVDDEETMRESILLVLRDEGYVAEGAGMVAEGLEALSRRSWNLVITDLKLPDGDGLEIVKASQERCPGSLVLIITAFATMDTAIRALRLGAVDYLAKPLNLDSLLLKIQRVLEHRRLRRENAWMRRRLSLQRSESGFIGESAPAREVRRLVGLYGPLDRTVLITGESGTGKELVARALHDASPRREGPFVAINSAAIPDALMESELFGHVRGAFTGAERDRKGCFQIADGGTLFLDEISELSMGLQAKLLRVLESKQILRVGGDVPVAVDVRVLAATNRVLPELIGDGGFREDLYFRLNVLLVDTPALSERAEDIPLLASHFIEKHRAELRSVVKGIGTSADACLRRYRWPGNVRELENVIQRAMILARGEWLEPTDLPREIVDACGGAVTADRAPRLREAVRDYERRLIVDAVERAGGDKSEAARALGISVASLYAKLKNGG
jgi:DNA-binding NtrC family response regulator